MIKHRSSFKPVVRAWAVPLVSIFLTTPATLTAQSRDVEAAILASRTGGIIMLCRHAKTTDFREREPVDYTDSTTQRLLSGEGERQSQRMGRVWRALKLPVDRVVASPMHRARRTAELMHDGAVEIDSIWHTNGSQYREPAVSQRKRVLRTPVGDGNLVVVSHIGTMRNALGESPGDVAEGDCVIVRPGEDDFDVVGVVPWQAWEGLLEPSPGYRAN